MADNMCRNSGGGGGGAGRIFLRSRGAATLTGAVLSGNDNEKTDL